MKLILGTVQLGLSYGINNTVGKISSEDSNTILTNAFTNGIDELDTAEAYGNAHEIIGEFHRNNPEFRFKINTKFPSNSLEYEIIEKINLYCSQLNVSKLESIFFHNFKNYKDLKSNTDIINVLKQNSSVNHIGVSIYTNDEFIELIEDNNIDIIQLPFNVFDNWTQRGELITKAKLSGKTLNSRSTFLQGLFFKDKNSDNKIVMALKKELEELDKISKKYDISIEEIALNYCLQQPEIDKVIIGVDSPSHLATNINSIKKLSIDVINDINQIKIKNIDLLNPTLWN